MRSTTTSVWKTPDGRRPQADFGGVSEKNPADCNGLSLEQVNVGIVDHERIRHIHREFANSHGSPGIGPKSGGGVRWCVAAS